MKRCSKCGETKPFSEFHKASRRKDGYRVWCKKCRQLSYAETHSPKQLKRLQLRKESKKICANCKRVKPFSEFGKLKKSMDGYRSHCLLCRRKMEKESYYANLEKSRESAKLRMRKWKSDPVNIKKARTWAINAYYKDPKGKNKKKKEWRKTPRGRRHLLRQLNRRRSSEQAVVNDLQDWHIILLEKLQRNRCAKCSKKFNKNRKYSLDHIIPVSKGGGLTLKNVQLLCKPCNSSKGIRTIQYRPDISEYYSWVT